MATNSKVCKFNRDWLNDPEYKDWLREVPDAKRAKCNLCQKDINLASMGISAVKSHARGDMHKKKMASKGQRLINFTATAAPPQAIVAAAPQEAVAAAPQSTTLDGFVSTKEVARAEALWALNTVKQHYSYNSSGETMDIVKVCINSLRILFIN